MDLIQLKMPPDRVQLVAEAIERDIEARPAEATSADLREVLIWLRYRISRWNTNRGAYSKK